MATDGLRTGARKRPPTVAEAKALSDRVCDAAQRLLFAKAGSDVGELVEAALLCASALERAAGVPADD